MSALNCFPSLAIHPPLGLFVVVGVGVVVGVAAGEYRESIREIWVMGDGRWGRI